MNGRPALAVPLPRSPPRNERGFQSLSSVTNNPSKPRSISAFVKDLVEQPEEERPAPEPTGELHGVPVPQVADFKPYLDTFACAWEVYERSHRAKLRAQPLGQAEGESGADDCDARRIVPAEFFREDFTLGESKYFEDIRRTVLRQDQHNAELTGYMDAVEVSLFKSIQAAQQDRVFDSVMSTGDPLREDITQALAVVRALRSRLQSAQRAQLRCGVAAARLARRRERVAEVLRLLEGFARMQHLEESVDALLVARNYMAAMELLESSSVALERDLGGFTSVELWCSRLARLGRNVALSVQAHFVQLSAEVVLGSQAGNTGLEGSCLPTTEPANAVPVGRLPDAEMLRTLCWCLAQRRELKSVLSSALRDKLLFELKKSLRIQVRHILQDLPPVVDSACGEGPASVEPAEQQGSPVGAATHAAPELPKEVGDTSGTADISTAVGHLGVEGFSAFWERILQHCTDVVERLCEHAAFVHGAARAPAGAEGGSGTPPHGRGQHVQVDVSDELLQLVDDVTDALLQKASALMQARQAGHQSLEVHEWRRLVRCAGGALERCGRLRERCAEAIGAAAGGARQELGLGLQAVLGAQTKPVVQAFHQRSLAEAQASLERERWERADVPSAQRQHLARVLGRERWPEGQDDAAEGQEPERFLRLQGAKYLAVPAVLVLMPLLAAYLELAQEWPCCSLEVSWCVVQLLRHFNQQAHKLVLGGQAVHTQILKKINATHLALCCQCCTLVEAFVPLLQEVLMQILQEASGPKGNACLEPVSDLSQVTAEYAGHRMEMFDKLSALLRERYEVHSKKWLGSPHPEAAAGEAAWLEAGEAPKAAELNPHGALEGLVKDISAMYSVLAKSLGADSLQKIFGKAFAEIAARFEQRLGSGLAAPTPPYGPVAGRSLGDRLALDVAFLQEQLGRHAHISTPLQHLLSDFARHLQAKLPADDPVRQLHPAVLEALQRLGSVPR